MRLPAAGVLDCDTGCPRRRLCRGVNEGVSAAGAATAAGTNPVKRMRMSRIIHPMAMLRHLGRGQRVILAADTGTKRCSAETGQAGSARAPHVVLASGNSAARIRNIECRASVAIAVSRADHGKQSGIIGSGNRLPIAEQPAIRRICACEIDHEPDAQCGLPNGRRVGGVGARCKVGASEPAMIKRRAHPPIAVAAQAIAERLRNILHGGVVLGRQNGVAGINQRSIREVKISVIIAWNGFNSASVDWMRSEGVQPALDGRLNSMRKSVGQWLSMLEMGGGWGKPSSWKTFL